MKEIIIFPFRNEDPFKNGCVQPYCIFHNALFEIIRFSFWLNGSGQLNFAATRHGPPVVDGCGTTTGTESTRPKTDILDVLTIIGP